ncbi:L-2-hydroxyglutarate oxidase [Leucobacter sp. W1038]|uniref:L-2-hydroxyglutarate oxidase n=1 Tax=Leucobacter sp. W1038 TaxID=3438281 RepID=UPI003D96E2AB
MSPTRAHSDLHPRSNPASLPEYDVAIIGCGIVGLAVGTELLRRQPGLRLLMLEKESEVAAHQTSHNSGVIHSGVYYAPGSLKAKLCVEGAALTYEYCDQKGIPYDRCGKLIVARTDEEVPRLEELFRRASVNGVVGVRWLEASEIPEIEPNCVGVAAVHSPNTGIVDYREISLSLAGDLRASGADIRLSSKVDRLTRREDRTVVELAAGEQMAVGYAIACAGLWSDQLAEASGSMADPQILPFRGAYLHLDLQGKDPRDVVRGMVYPVPNPNLPFLGVHITRHVDGNVSLGPTAMISLARNGYGTWSFNLADVWSIATWPGSWRVLRGFWKTALSELRFRMSRKTFVAACAEFMPSLAGVRLKKHASAGVRAQAVSRDGRMADDFIISKEDGIAHIRNAPSPAATSAFAISRYIADELEPHLTAQAS